MQLVFAFRSFVTHIAVSSYHVADCGRGLQELREAQWHGVFVLAARAVQRENGVEHAVASATV